MQRKRSSLHPRVHLIVGTLISAFSGYVLLFTQTPNPAAMQLFLGVGVLFLLIGGVKLFLRSAKPKEKEFAEQLSGIKDISKEEQNYNRELERLDRLQGKSSPQARQDTPRQSSPQIVLCPLCKTKNYITSNFCHMCGAKLK